MMFFLIVFLEDQTAHTGAGRQEVLPAAGVESRHTRNITQDSASHSGRDPTGGSREGSLPQHSRSDDGGHCGYINCVDLRCTAAMIVPLWSISQSVNHRRGLRNDDV